MNFRTLLRFTGLTLALAFFGCAATEVYEPDKAPEYQVSREYAPFYQDGPMQTRGPDLSLRLNDRVKLLKKDFTGFAIVEISDGRRGYVAFEDLAPAPPRPPAPAEPASRSSSGRRSMSSEPTYFGPQNNDIPLPDASAPPVDLNVGPEEIPAGPTMIDPVPESTEKPKFRY